MKPILTLLLCLVCASAQADKLVTYPAPQGAELNNDFDISVRTPGGQWQHVDAYAWKVDKLVNCRHTAMKSSVAYFDFEGTVEVEVKSLRQPVIDSCRVRPLSYNIPVSTEGNTIRFTLDRPHDLSIEVNGEIFHNLQLFANGMEPKVKKVAYKYISSVKGASEYRDDIENAARIGIHRALMRFDFTYSGFDSYMERAMDMEVRSFLSDGLRTIRLPKHMIESIRKYRNGDEYLSVEKEKKVKEAMKREECISLDASFSGDDRGRTLSETISSSSYVEEEYEKMESISVLEKALGMLDGEELYVIATSFGVLDHPKKKAKAVAEELGVSVGTIAARKKNGMRKLRSYLTAC